MYVFCLSNPSATFALQHGSFVPPEWLAAKGLFLAPSLDLVLQCVLTGVECWLCIICVFTFPLTPFRYKVVCLKYRWKSFSDSYQFENVSNTKRRQRGRRKSKRFNKQNNNSARSAHLFVQSLAARAWLGREVSFCNVDDVFAAFVSPLLKVFICMLKRTWRVTCHLAKC